MIVGAQLYTLREWMTTEQQVVDTLQKVSDLGFTHVQLSGHGPRRVFTGAAAGDRGRIRAAHCVDPHRSAAHPERHARA